MLLIPVRSTCNHFNAIQVQIKGVLNNKTKLNLGCRVSDSAFSHTHEYLLVINVRFLSALVFLLLILVDTHTYLATMCWRFQNHAKANNLKAMLVIVPMT